MLESLHVKNLALIKETQIEFTRGLNVLTGETGAGKSILMGSVSLALGGRASKDIIRTGEEEASVTLVFENTPELKAILRGLELDSEEDSIILSRKLSQTKNVFKINGEIVPLKTVKELAGYLIDIHGQHEHQSLLNVLKQRDMIDAFGGDKISGLLKETGEKAALLKDKLSQIEELEKKNQLRAREISLLSYELEEIEKASLKEGEDEEVESEYKRMISCQKLNEFAYEALNLVSGENSNDAGSFLSKAIQNMQKASNLDDKALGLYEKLREAEEILGDFSMECADYIEGLTFDEESFENMEKRLDLINLLKAKFGPSLEDINTYYVKKKEELDLLNNLEENLCKLKNEASKLEKEYESLSDELTKERKRTSEKFSLLLVDALKDLNFLDVKFYVNFERDEELISKKGKDQLEFMISTNPGEPVRPVKNVASGGELSRIMLAIKTILAREDGIDALIFDEIDSGISGHTAWEVSKKLNELSKNHQVICISHLAQIAAMADSHYEINKGVEEGFTKTLIKKLDEDEKIIELARLLGGNSDSEAAIINAKDLKANAVKEKKLSE